MQKFVAATGLVFGLFVAQAFAGDPAPATTDDTKTEQATEEVDCATLEGEEKTKCEAEKAATETETTEEPAPAAEPAKGGKAKRSNTNRLEGEVTDE